MSDKKKFTEEEVKQVKELQEAYTKKTILFGQLEVQKNLLQKELVQIEQTIKNAWLEYEELSKTESSLLNSLNEKYGEGTLDLDSGEFIPNK